jgi:hypothetical protein
MIAAACAASAMLTKQAGIQFVAVFPILAFIALRRSGKVSSSVLTAACAIGLTLLLALPWYALKYVDFKNQKDISEIAMVAGAHAGRDFAQRAVFGWHMVRDTMMPLPAAPLAIGLVVLSLFSRAWRPHAILIVVPGLVLWTLMYSYDLRNMTIVLPFLGTASAVGLHTLCRMLAAHGVRFGALPAPARWAAIVVVLAGVLMYMNWWVDHHTLYAYQVRKQKLVGYPDLNTVIYQYAAEQPLDRPMLTNYQFVGYLPELSKVYRWEMFNDLARLREHMQQQQPGFLLFAEVGPFAPTAEVMAYMDSRITDGSFEVVRRWQGWRMIRIKTPAIPALPATTRAVAQP